MKRILAKLAVSVIMVILSQELLASDYYLSSVSGDDSRTAAQAQNPNTPWRSIKKLNSVFSTLRPGDAVYFKRGETYYGTIHINKSGTSGSPIKISAYGTGAKPIITSLIAIEDWKSIGGGKYESKVPTHISKVNVVLMNNKMLELGRYPNSDVENEGYLTIEAVSGNSTIKGQGISGSPNWKGGDVVIKKNPWVIDVQKIDSHNGTSLSFKNGSTYPPVKGWGFFIQNHIQTLDKEGEWYFDPSSKRMNVFMGSKNPSSYQFEATTLDHLLTKTYGASNVHINNLFFNGSNSDAIYIAGGNNIQFHHVEIENAGGDGIKSLSVLNFVMENNKVTNTYNNGISLNYGNVGAILKNNSVENAGTVAGRHSNGDGNNIGILARNDNTLIEKNTVRNTGYSGIYFGGNNTIVKNNLVENFVLIKADGGGIYTYDGSSSSALKNRKVINNIVLNARGSWGGTPQHGANFKPLAEGIFLDDNSSGIEVAGNTVAHATNNTLKMSNVSDIIVRDNTFFNGSSLLTLGNNDLGRDPRRVTIQNNIFFSKYTDQSSYRINTKNNDISQMGTFNGNYFFRPFGDEFSIHTKYQSNSGTVEKEEDLGRWQKAFGKDKDSKSPTVAIEKYKFLKYKGANQFDNGGFQSNIRGINSSGRDASWSSNKINGGSLQVIAGESSSIMIEIGRIKKGQNYSIEFAGLSNKESAIKAFFRYHQTPWEQVSPSTTFVLNTNQSSHKAILTAYEDVESAVLIIRTVDSNFTYWMDDLQIREVEVDENESERRILFEYNAGHSAKTLNLDGAYVDAKNKQHSGSVTIAPFESVVLVRISSEAVKEDAKESVPTVQLSLTSSSTSFVEGESLGLKANVVANGANIKRVDFYNGLKLIGSSVKSPYQTIWNDIPGGKHYVWASAIDDKGKEVISQEIDLDVRAIKVIDPEKAGGPAESVRPVTDMYFNTTVNDSYIYKSKGFDKIPDGHLKTSGTNVTTNTTVSKDKLFQKGRFAGSLAYAIPVPNGTYTVETYHMETYFGKSGRAERAGQRVFDISLEGQVVKKGLDMFLENGNKETILTFNNIVVKDGILNLDMVASSNNAIISGIAIVGASVQVEAPKVPTPAANMYFNTTVNDSYIYKSKGFDKIPDGHLKTSGTNVTTNTTVSKDKLFQKGRFAGTLAYAIPVPNGTYTVETYHMETYFGKRGRAERAGQRVFDISLEGKVVKKGLDMFLENGNKETILTFNNIVVKDGILNLDMVASSNNAIISGIAIVGASVQVEAPKVPTPAANMYFNTTVNDSYIYKSKGFDKIPDGHLKTSGTNVTTNTTVSKDKLFQKGRFAGTLAYAIPVPNGTYTVETYHMETYFGKSGRAERAGQRVFDISLEGKVVKKGLDMFLENGNKETILTFNNIVVKDGILNLDMVASSNNAIISGIVIKDASVGSANLKLSSPMVEILAEKQYASKEVAVNKIQMYPNPAKSQTTIVVNVEVNSIIIHNLNGQMINQFDPRMLKSGQGKYIVPLSNMSQGLYMVTLVGERGIIERLKLLVNP